MENTPVRLVARVLRTLIAEQRFESYGDLKDALYRKCYALKLKPQPGHVVVNAAIHLLESNTTLVHSSGLQQLQSRHRRTAVLTPAPVLPQTVAAALLARLQGHGGLRSMSEVA